MIVGSLVLIASAVVLLVAGLGLSSTGLLGGSIAASVLAALVLVVGARRAPARPVRHHQARHHGMARADRSHRRAGPGRVRDHGRAAEPGAPSAAGAGTEPGDPAGPAVGATAATATITAPVPAQPGAGPGASARPAEDPAVLPEEQTPAGWEPEAAASEVEAQPVETPHGQVPKGQQAALAPPAVTESQQAATQMAGHAPVEDPHEVDDFDGDPPDEPAPQPVSAADVARVAQLATEVLVVDGRPRYHLAGCVHLLGRQSEPLPVGEAIELGFTPCGLCEPDSALLADIRRG